MHKDRKGLRISCSRWFREAAVGIRNTGPPSKAGEVGILASKGFGCRAQDLEPYPPSVVREPSKGSQKGSSMSRLLCSKVYFGCSVAG